MEEIHAKISGVTFSNRSTGFYILRASSEQGPVAVRGSFPGVQIAVGLRAKFVGKWEDHATYGRQFSASSCEVLPEKNRSGIVTYLQANVPSIGPITAARLYEQFGDELLTILEEDPEKIRDASFLQARQIDSIIAEWRQSSDNRTAAVFLTDLGLNAHQVKSAILKLGVKDVRGLVQSDPYCLCRCDGIGFPTADSVARKVGVGVDDPKRIRAMVSFALSELASSEGHMFCTSSQILEYVSRRMFRAHSLDPFGHGEYMSDSHFFAALTDLSDSGSVVTDGTHIYLRVNWENESRSAEALSKMVAQKPREFGDLHEVLQEFEPKFGLSLSEEQRQAFLMMGKSRVCVVSGYPGTGKTLLISAFVHLFERFGLHYVLMSPTGIASKRLSQVTGRPATTIHRSLGYGRDGVWAHCASNKFFCDAVIVDEMSMVDGSTFFHLVSALPPTTILVMVGDSAQLPSVGAGYVLNNLMRCPGVPHVALTRIYRQDKASDIVSVAHSILHGQPVDTSFNQSSEFVFLQYPKDQVLEEVSKMASLLKSKEKNFQVIAPMYDGDLGVNNLNRSLRGVLNSDFVSGKAGKLKSGTVDIYEGDRVMVVKNDYDKMIFNGEVGKVLRISTKQDEVEVKIFDWFDHESQVPRYVDKVFTFKIDEARSVLKVAYACTAHKVQGQEFDFVLMPMTMQYGIMLYRNLVYTALTRAKKKVFLFGDPRAFSYSITNDRETVRNSRLRELIQTYVNGVPDPDSDPPIELEAA
jgi:exodeoxyribonuclease V alpha subunit